MSGEKLIASNPNAKTDYFIEDRLEAGIELKGTEIKSIREQNPNLKESFVEFTSKGPKIEAWLTHCHIAPYKHGNIWNHEPKRKRKLLLHKKQIERLYGATTQKGKTVVPIKMYFRQGLAKVEIGVGKGKKKHDKRETIRKKTMDKEMAQAIRKKR